MAGLYIHIPFCRSKCAYCDFFSAAGHTSDTSAYIDALIAEWHMRKAEIGGGNAVSTIYIGGGTPSMLHHRLLSALTEALASDINLAALQEFTIEANPEDISAQTLSLYKSLGINRVSIGVQSFEESELNAVNRQHSPQAARAALNALATSGINYNADLIYGLPGQTPASWKTNIEQLLQYQPPHLSAYLLSYEPGTRLYTRLLAGKVQETDEATATEMYNMLCHAAARAGYNHYEISNFAKPGFQALHNSAYWNCTPYLGLGCAAHSFDGLTRRFNPSGIKKYINAINSGTPFCQTEDETDENRINDYIITSLRTANGFSPGFARARFGNALTERFLNEARQLLASGQLTTTGNNKSDTTADDNRNIRIPEQKWLTSDSILRQLIL